MRHSLCILTAYALLVFLTQSTYSIVVPGCQWYNEGICTLCFEDYALTYDGKCVRRDYRCLDKHCMDCEGFFNRCRICTSGYKPNSLGSCVSNVECKIPNCFKCKSTDSTKCVTCNAGYYDNQVGVCVNKCNADCQKCDIPRRECIACDSGFWLDIIDGTFILNRYNRLLPC